jgi:hypothetical protein
MSTQLHDLAHQATLAHGLSPRTLTTTTNGPAVDLVDADGRCVAVQTVGTVSGTSPTLAGKIQESADGASGWADISGATFTTVTASDNLQSISFDRTLRYVRYVATVGGTTPSFVAGAIVGEQKKQC